VSMSSILHVFLWGLRCFVHRNLRIETLLTYAQVVYLLFASVYVCKETVEHFLLSFGEGQHHHHHHSDGAAHITG
jgi:hypothetical protein